MEKGRQKYHLNHINGQPVFRIGLFNDQEHIDFRVMGEFSVCDGENNVLVKNVQSDLKWRVKIKESKPGKEEYFLIVYGSFDRELAEKKLRLIQEIDRSATLMVLGGDIYLQNRRVNNNTKYVVAAGSFSSELAARKAFKRFQPDYIPYVEKKRIREPAGQIETFDAEYDQSAEVNNVLRIVPKDPATKVKIFGVRRYDEILQKEYYEDMVFNGTLEFRLDINGGLMAISEVPLELYLQRVIYSEIGAGLPLEFCKSLAIVCRSEAMARIGHRCLGEPFDYDNVGATLRYFGLDFDDETIQKAVETTAGEVIFSRNYIRDTAFHLICGGHTEDAAGANGSEETAIFKGRFDWQSPPAEFDDLRDERTVKKWIAARPEAWCNLKGRQLPESLERVKKYFRWEVDYPRRELEDIIRKKTGEDIGILYEIMPLSRGSSGRLREIELIGSLKNYRIRGELNIRAALAYEYLPSSCFVVEQETDENGTPISFTFVGAGQGHGVGMCKTGAAVMALEKHKSKNILEHYFESCRIQSIYDVDLDKK